jgi:prephenate dehydrogenase
MLLVPTEASTDDVVEQVKVLFQRLGFRQMVVTTPAHHDRMIAYTSQLCHVISSAYVKSRAETEHKGYSGGSYRDLTRVAYLNETMWTELFLENAPALVPEIDEMIQHLQEYRDTIAAGDAETLFQLLKEGRERKERFG